MGREGRDCAGIHGTRISLGCLPEAYQKEVTRRRNACPGKWLKFIDEKPNRAALYISKTAASDSMNLVRTSSCIVIITHVGESKAAASQCHE